MSCKFWTSLSVLLYLIIASSLPGIAQSVDTPTIISRADWGAAEATGELPKHTITHITIHHSGELFTEDQDPITYMRGLQRFSQQDKGWIDIPYHYCLDLKGTIYEARSPDYPGDTNTEYDPAGHLLIDVMGNYEVQTLKPEQLEALAHLTAYLADKYSVPLSNIATHKDYSDQTVCPGKDLYKYFEDGSFIDTVELYLTSY